ncbi:MULTISPECIES: ABC transporter substrate-binding protein [Giesbergeria]|uniref:ABC transporter substrate-binding protein n=1 Tax=Giesbergeria sinuosa TaxID=80883 RepID=A0ABV9QFW0_9BURK
MPISRRHATAALLSAPPAALWGLPGPAQAQARGRHHVVIGLSLEPNSLDPTSAPSASIGEVVHYTVLEGLTRIEESGAVSPLLAQSWSRSPDGKTYTFQLLKGVRFHDDAPLDAAAVKFSFERAQAPHSNNKAQRTLFNNVTGITTPDPHTVVITLQHPDGNFLFRLGENTAVILHPASAAQASGHPIGTGPYRFEHWKKGHSIHLRKFAGYRQASQVQLERAVFRFINDPVEQASAVFAEEVDILFNIATQNVQQFQSNNRYQVVIGSSNGKGMLAMNNRRKPLDDVRVRRAITHAIDREAFIQRMLDGRGRVIGSHFSPSEPGYVHLAGLYPYDPAKARALLQEAGVKTPLTLGLTLPPTPYARTDRSMLMDNLAQIGIELKPEHVTWPQWLEGAFKGHFDLTMINHVEPLDYPIYADPDYYFGYDSPVFRELMARHAASDNPRERQMLFAQLQRHLAQDAVNAWIFASQITAVARKGLKGWWMNYPIFAHDIAAMRWA